MIVKPDPDQRNCTDCNGIFSPWSMDPDGMPRVPAPKEYQCLSCRSKVTK